MYSKSLYQILRNLLLEILRRITMSTSGGDAAVSNETTTYSFKPFVCEEIKSGKNNKVPYPRSGHRIVADSSNFYSFGGYNPLSSNESNNDIFWVQSFPLFQELWKFNFAKKEWMRYPNRHTLPNELASNAMLLHKNWLMVYGGTGSPFGFRCSNQLFVCKINDELALMNEVRTRGQLPIPGYGQALVYHNDYLYTIGGTTGVAYTCDIHRLNLKTLDWEVVYESSSDNKNQYQPTGRYRHEVCFDSDNIYILGGGTSTEAFDFRDVPVFNLDKGGWSFRKTLEDPLKGTPPARRCHGAVQVNTATGNQVFIVGGHDGENSFNDVWRLDLQTFQWTYLVTCSLPRPLHFHATAVTPEGRLYVFGGICTNNIDDDDDLDVRRCNTIYSSWLCIPKLSEICWEAMLHYSPHIVNCDRSALVDIGLPRHFVQRLGNKDLQEIDR